MYFTNYTQVDIAYAMNNFSRFTSNSSNDHWNTLNGVLRYLRYTLNFGLYFTRYPAVLEGYYGAN